MLRRPQLVPATHTRTTTDTRCRSARMKKGRGAGRGEREERGIYMRGYTRARDTPRRTRAILQRAKNCRERSCGIRLGRSLARHPDSSARKPRGSDRTEAGEIRSERSVRRSFRIQFRALARGQEERKKEREKKGSGKGGKPEFGGNGIRGVRRGRTSLILTIAIEHFSTLSSSSRRPCLSPGNPPRRRPPPPPPPDWAATETGLQDRSRSHVSMTLAGIDDRGGSRALLSIRPEEKKNLETGISYILHIRVNVQYISLIRMHIFRLHGYSPTRIVKSHR